MARPQAAARLGTDAPAGGSVCGGRGALCASACEGMEVEAGSGEEVVTMRAQSRVPAQILACAAREESERMLPALSLLISSSLGTVSSVSGLFF